MKSVLVDTNAYSNLLRGDDRVLNALTDADTVLMSPVVIAELIAGFRQGSKYRQNKQLLNEFLQTPAVTIMPITEETAEIYGNLHYSLKRAGRPIPTNDLWIAAQSVEHGAVLITYDRHFTSIDKLRIWEQH